MKWAYNWRVRSDSSDKEYTVSIADDGTFGCSCPAWTRRRIECKHIKKIKRYKGADINWAIGKFEIPLELDIMTRDWVKVGPRKLDEKQEYPLKCIAKTMSAATDCKWYLKGYCSAVGGPQCVIDPIAKVMDEKIAKPAPTLMTLITQNAKWRI